MNRKNLKSNQSPLFVTCVIVIILVLSMACNPSGNNKNSTEIPTPVTAIQEDTTHLTFYTNGIDSIRIIWVEEEKEITTYMDEKDFTTLAVIMENGEYDTVWNDKDIMIKMVAPDYTLIISYENKDQENNDFLMIWKDNGKVKYQNTWYILPEHSIQQLSTLLDSYRHI